MPTPHGATSRQQRLSFAATMQTADLDAIYLDFDSEGQESCLDGFDDVADASSRAIAPILRHLRSEAYTRAGSRYGIRPRRQRRSTDV